MGGWFKMDYDVTARTDLTATAKLVYGILADHARSTGKAWPGRRRLARLAGCSPETIRVSLAQLMEAKLIEKDGTGRASYSRFKLAQSGTDSGPVGGTDSGSPDDCKVVQILGGGGTDSGHKAVQILVHKQKREIEAENTPCSPPVGDDPAERLYLAYPRHVGPRKAKDAIRRALEAIAGRLNAPADPVGWLAGRVEAYAAAVGRWPEADRKFVPHPTTWFNQGRYDDDPSEWERKNKHGQSLADLSEYGRVDIEA